MTGTLKCRLDYKGEHFGHPLRPAASRQGSCCIILFLRPKMNFGQILDKS
nr:MAG TPA: hypothetical protein [Caudoviricetes sp.]